jgi:nitrate/nitrite transport system substrate-binding protein
MRRWGQIAEGMPDSWYEQIARDVYKPEIYLEAARLLIEDGVASAEDFPFDTDGYREPQSEFIDEIVFDGRRPNAYLEQFPIGLKGDDRVTDGEVLSAR